MCFIVPNQVFGKCFSICSGLQGNNCCQIWIAESAGKTAMRGLMIMSGSKDMHKLKFLTFEAHPRHDAVSLWQRLQALGCSWQVQRERLTGPRPFAVRPCSSPGHLSTLLKSCKNGNLTYSHATWCGHAIGQERCTRLCWGRCKRLCDVKGTWKGLYHPSLHASHSCRHQDVWIQYTGSLQIVVHRETRPEAGRCKWEQHGSGCKHWSWGCTDWQLALRHGIWNSRTYGLASLRGNSLCGFLLSPLDKTRLKKFTTVLIAMRLESSPQWVERCDTVWVCSELM